MLTHTRYEWSQVMRRMETEMRYARDDYMTFQASGDKEGANQTMAKIHGLMDAYNGVAAGAKLPVDYSRTWLDRLDGIGKKSNISLTMNGENSIITSENGGYYRRRKIKNSGAFSVYQEPISLSHVKKVLRQMGIYRKGVRYILDDNPELVGREFYGYTSPDGTEITYYPDAFKDRETLVKTLGHEDTHYQQIKEHGIAIDTTECARREKEASDLEQGVWKDYQKKGLYHEK